MQFIGKAIFKYKLHIVCKRIQNLSVFFNDKH